jgi:hypothetical protein
MITLLWEFLREFPDVAVDFIGRIDMLEVTVKSAWSAAKCGNNGASVVAASRANLKTSTLSGDRLDERSGIEFSGIVMRRR